MRRNYIIAEILNKVNLTANEDEAVEAIIELKNAKEVLDEQIKRFQEIINETDAKKIPQIHNLRANDYQCNNEIIDESEFLEREEKEFKSLVADGYTVKNCENKIIAKDGREFYIYRIRG